MVTQMEIIKLSKDDEGQITLYNDFGSFESREEIAHIMAELDLMKQDLLNIWNKFEEYQEGAAEPAVEGVEDGNKGID